MFDLYRLPDDTPGAADRPRHDCHASVAHIEAAIRRSYPARNFVPHVTLHEFETLLFVDPGIVADHAGRPDLARRMQRIVTECGGEPERIDDGATTSPSQRLRRMWPDYRKTVDGTASCRRSASIGSEPNAVTSMGGSATIEQRSPG